MDIVILGYKVHPYTISIIAEFRRRGMPVKALVQRRKIDYPPQVVLATLMTEGFSWQELFSSRFLNFDTLRQVMRNPWFAIRFLIHLVFGSSKFQQTDTYLHDMKSQFEKVDFKGLIVETVDDFNSQRSEQVLRRLAPDVIILGPAAQIIRDNVLRIPQVGTLNAHQGILPKYRGMDVLEYSILKGDQPGITVHFVDKGIDTGDLLLRRYLRIAEGMTVAEILSQAEKLSVQALADGIEIIKSGNYQREIQNPEDGKQYYPMHSALKAIVRSRLQESHGTGTSDRS